MPARLDLARKPQTEHEDTETIHLLLGEVARLIPGGYLQVTSGARVREDPNRPLQ